MAKLIISRDAQVVQEVELGDRPMTIGRHPHNDIVIAHLAVSGRHATVSRSGGGIMLEDLGSSNGTFVNGQRVERVALGDLDRFTVAAYQLEYVADRPPAPGILGSIEVLNGARAGKFLSLLKPLTTLGSPGVMVVVISRQANGYYIARVQGAAVGRINDDAIGPAPRLLMDGDILELTGTRMRFSAKIC